MCAFMQINPVGGEFSFRLQPGVAAWGTDLQGGDRRYSGLL